MGFFDNGLGLAAIVGAVLLGAAMLYAYFRNRASSDRDRAHTEQATRDLYRAEGAAEQRRSDTAP